MAIIWMDGPDHYGTDRNLLLNGVYAEATNTFLEANSGPGGVGTVFRFGAARLRKVLPGERTLVGVGNRWYFDTLPVVPIEMILFLDLLGGELGSLQLLPTGALQYVSGVAGAVIWRGDPVIVSRSWQHIECVVDFSDQVAGGKLRIGVDSVTIYDNDAIKTQPVTVPAQLPCSQIVWVGVSGLARDLYIWDDTGAINNSGMQGDRQIVTTFPTSDALNDWVPSAGGTGWPLVSNDPPVDADFISANAPDLISTFGMGDIDTDITNISAVMVVSRLWKSDAGLATIKLRVTSSGNTAEGAEKAVSTDKVFYASIFETDPHTGIKWTPGAVNAVTAGLKRIS